MVNDLFSRQNGRVVPSGIFSPGTGKIWLDDLECLGSEESLADCTHNGWGQHDCGHAEDVSITCQPNPLAGRCNHVSVHPMFCRCNCCIEHTRFSQSQSQGFIWCQRLQQTSS